MSARRRGALLGGLLVLCLAGAGGAAGLDLNKIVVEQPVITRDPSDPRKAGPEAASSRGGSRRTLQIIGGAIVLAGALLLGYGMKRNRHP